LRLFERSEFARALWQGLERTESVCWVCFFGSFFAQAKNEHLQNRTAIKKKHNVKPDQSKHQKTTRPG
jgi:hypothetical protein